MPATVTTKLTAEQLAGIVGTQLSPREQQEFFYKLAAPLGGRPWYVRNPGATGEMEHMCKSFAHMATHFCGGRDYS